MKADRYKKIMLGNNADKMMEQATKFCTRQDHCFSCRYHNRKCCHIQFILEERERLSKEGEA